MRRYVMWGALLFLVVGGMVFASLASAGSGDRELLAQLVRRVDARLGQPLVRDRALHGELVDGEATVDYALAIERMDALRTPVWEKVPAGASWRAVREDPEVLALRQKWRVALDEVGRGAHRRELSRQDAMGLWGMTTWERVLQVELDSVVGDGVVGDGVLGDGAIDEGDAVAAVARWLDVLTMVLDGLELAGSPFDARAFASNGHAMCEMVSDRVVARLPGDARALLRQALDEAARRAGEGGDLELMLATASRHVLDPAHFLADASLGKRLESWQHGFSPINAVVADVASAIAALPLVVPSAEAWPEREAQLQRFARATGEEWGHRVRSWDLHRRSLQLDLRCLSLALAFSMGEDPGELDDPLRAGAIRVERRADGVRIASDSFGTPRERRVAR